MSWRKNVGICPPEARGKRVKVRLRNGTIQGSKPVSPTSPAGWPADATGPNAKLKAPPINWGLDPRGEFPADVIEWDFL